MDHGTQRPIEKISKQRAGDELMVFSRFLQRVQYLFPEELDPMDFRGPSISIIIPTFRCAKKLELSIASVIRQQRKIYELIVIDGDSRDETIDVLRAHESNLIWRSEPDGGIYDAMNKGIALSSGRYLYFLGAGDCLRENALARIESHLPESNESMGFVYGDVFMHDKNVVWDGLWTPEKFRKRNLCQQAIFYDRRIFSRHGLFDQRFKTMADYAMNIKCFGDPRIAKLYHSEIIADYEGGGRSAKHRDVLFYSRRPELIRRHLGISPGGKM